MEKLLPIIFSLLRPSSQASGSALEVSALDIARKAVRAEVLIMAFRLSLAVVITSGMVFLMIQLVVIGQNELSQFSKRPIIEFFGLLVVFIALGALLFFTLKSSNSEEEVAPNQSSDPIFANSISGLVVNFGEGFLIGYSANQRKKTNRDTVDFQSPSDTLNIYSTKSA